MSDTRTSKEITEARLLNTRAWARARPDMSGSEVIVGAIDELLARRAAHEPRPVEAWHGQRKVTIYPDSVMRVWGPNIETDMIDEPRTLASVQAAFGWLYSAQPPGVFSQEQMLTALVHADPIFGPGQTETIRTFIHELPRHIARATATKPDECSHDGFRTCRKCGASLGEPDAR
jgi:hypothetical protein